MKVNRRNKIRWVAIFGYFLLILAYLVYTYVNDFNEELIIGYLVLIFGGFFFILIVLIYPYFFPINRPVIEDREVIDLTEQYTDESYFEEVKLRFLYYMTLPFIVIYIVLAVVMIFQGSTSEALIFAVVSAFFLTIFVLFEHMTIIGYKDELVIKFGPFEERIMINQIISARPTAIKPLRTYLGYGKRIGTDGTIGYIAGAKTGVRLELQETKSYVLTSLQPKKLVAFVRSRKNS